MCIFLKTAASGLYTGTVKVSFSNGQIIELPVQLTVRNFVLPETPSSKTMVFLGYKDIAKRYTGKKILYRIQNWGRP